LSVRAVTFLIYNRPDVTRRAFECIRKARPTHLLVSADGPRSEADRALCQAARDAATAVTWPCELVTNFSEANLGCNPAMIRGITWGLEQVGESVILEDDCLASPEFFPFAWEMLNRYRDDDRVMHISGECYHPAAAEYAESYYFSYYALCWGWATWRRAWARFDPDLAGWRGILDGPLAHSLFDSLEEEEYWLPLLRTALDAAPHTLSWDYLWYAACWLNHGLSIHPRANLVANIGGGDAATHTRQLGALADRPWGTLGDLVYPRWMVRDRAADAATFGVRYPGAYLRRRKTLAYRAMLPARKLKRWLFNRSQ
jgi:hypothetical protein